MEHSLLQPRSTREGVWASRGVCGATARPRRHPVRAAARFPAAVLLPMALVISIPCNITTTIAFTGHRGPPDSSPLAGARGAASGCRWRAGGCCRRVRTKFRPKRTEKQTKLPDVEVGQPLNGTFVNVAFPAGVLVDIGEDGKKALALLEVAEFRSGFPRRGLPWKKNQEMSVRVLRVSEDGTKVFLTELEGDLERREFKLGNNKARVVKQFVGNDDWIDGEVVHMTFKGLFVEIEHPDTCDRVVGFVPKQYVAETSADKAAVGARLSVRILSTDLYNARLCLTMIDPDELDKEEHNTEEKQEQPNGDDKRHRAHRGPPPERRAGIGSPMDHVDEEVVLAPPAPPAPPAPRAPPATRATSRRIRGVS